MKYTRIEIIYDARPASAGFTPGWYSRDTQADGTQEDTAISEEWAEDRDAPESTIRAWAVTFYADLDGMNDAELQHLRDIIEVKR